MNQRRRDRERAIARGYAGTRLTRAYGSTERECNDRLIIGRALDPQVGIAWRDAR